MRKKRWREVLSCGDRVYSYGAAVTPNSSRGVSGTTLVSYVRVRFDGYVTFEKRPHLNKCLLPRFNIIYDNNFLVLARTMLPSY